MLFYSSIDYCPLNYLNDIGIAYYTGDSPLATVLIEGRKLLKSLNMTVRGQRNSRQDRFHQYLVEGAEVLHLKEDEVTVGKILACVSEVRITYYLLFVHAFKG